MSEDPNNLSRVTAQLEGLEKSVADLTAIGRDILKELKDDREGARVVNQQLFTRLGEVYDDVKTLQRGTNEGFGSLHDILEKLRREVKTHGARQDELEQSVDELAAAERGQPRVASQAPGDR